MTWYHQIAAFLHRNLPRMCATRRTNLALLAATSSGVPATPANLRRWHCVPGNVTADGYVPPGKPGSQILREGPVLTTLTRETPAPMESNTMGPMGTTDTQSPTLSGICQTQPLGRHKAL